MSEGKFEIFNAPDGILVRPLSLKVLDKSICGKQIQTEIKQLTSNIYRDSNCKILVKVKHVHHRSSFRKLWEIEEIRILGEDAVEVTAESHKEEEDAHAHKTRI